MCTTRLIDFFRRLFVDPDDYDIPTLAYPRFDPKTLGPDGPHRTALVVGCAGSGKTTLIKSFPRESTDMYPDRDILGELDLEELSKKGRVVIDDVSFNYALTHSTDLRKLFLNSKRIIMSIQTPLEVGVDIRSNVDVVFVAKPFWPYLDQVYNAYFTYLLREEYERLMTNLEPYEFLVVERSRQYIGTQRVSLYKPAINSDTK